MLLLKIIGLLLSIKASAFSIDGEKFWPTSAKINENIGNFSVQINTSSFRGILKSKKNIEVKYFWSKKSEKLICEHKLLCPILKNKLNIVSGNVFSKYIKNYELVESINGWKKYKDSSGTQDYTEVSIKFSQDKLSLIQKKPTGTEYINYKFQNDKFGKVLVEVEHKAFVGLQKFKTITSIEYGEHLKLRLPSKIIMVTNQSLITTDVKTTKRKVEEIYLLEDYVINNKSNLESIDSSK
jgi:hypothetical protein